MFGVYRVEGWAASGLGDFGRWGLGFGGLPVSGFSLKEGVQDW